jgi:hypothetical protein
LPPTVIASSPAPAVTDTNAPDEEPIASSGNYDEGELQEVFGAELTALIAARQPVKLDPSVDRSLFRSQRDWLGQRLSYSFRAASQTWHSM